MALLMKPEPFASDIDRLVNTLFDRSQAPQRWVPAMDLVEAEDHFLLRADLPGMSEADVTIEVRDNALTVSDERKAEHEQREKGWYRLERQFGRFSRSISLPEGIDADAVTASFDTACSRYGSRSPSSASRAGSRSAARRATAAPRRSRGPRRSGRSRTTHMRVLAGRGRGLAHASGRDSQGQDALPMGTDRHGADPSARS